MIICCIIKLTRLSTVWGTRFIIVEQELLTLSKHPVLSGGHIGFCVQLHVFMFVVPCYNVNYDFVRTTMHSHLFCKGLSFTKYIFNLYLFTHTCVQRDFHIWLWSCGLTVIWRLSLVEQDLLILSDHPCLPCF